MLDILASSLKHNYRFLHLHKIMQKFIVHMFHDEVQRNQVFYSIEINRIKRTPVFSRIYL